MIQRIQSIFLLLAALAMGALFTKPMSFISIFGQTEALEAAPQSMLADGVFDVQDHIILLVLVALAAILFLAGIFLFNNRPLQLTITRIGLIGAILSLLLAGVFFYMDYQNMADGTLVTVEFGVLGPVLAIIFAILALRFIGKDEKLVRSMDRLR